MFVCRKEFNRFYDHFVYESREFISLTRRLCILVYGVIVFLRCVCMKDEPSVGLRVASATPPNYP